MSEEGPRDTDRPLHVFLVAGEASGDQLGAALIPALTRASPTNTAS